MIDDFYKSALEELPIGYACNRIICDENNLPCDYEFVEVNSEFEKITGLKQSDMVGKRVSEISSSIVKHEMRWIKIYGDIAINGGSRTVEEYYKDLRKYYRIKVISPKEYYFIIYIQETSNEVFQLEELKKLRATLRESELKYVTVANYAHEWETWEDRNGKFAYVSPACERVSGYTYNEFIKDEALLQNIILDEDKHIWRKHRQEVENNKNIHKEQFRIRHKNGEIVWIEHTCNPVANEDGMYLGYRANNRDITDCKHSAEKLKENEIQFEKIIGNLPFSLSIVTIDGTILYINQKSMDIFGLDESSIGTKSTLLFWGDPKSRSKWLETLEEKGVVKDFEMYLKNKDGKCFWAMGSGLIIKYKGQTCILSTQHDITEQRSMAESLRKSEEQYRLLFENAVEAIVVIQDEKIKISNPSTDVLTGYQGRELYEKNFLDLIYQEDLSTVEEFYHNCLIDRKENNKQQFRIVRKSGEVRWVESDGIQFLWNGGEATLNFVIDITERKKVEDALKASEEKYRLLTEYASDVIWVYNLRIKKVTYISPATFQLRGYTAEEVIEQSIEEMLTPKSLSIVKDSINRNAEEFIQNPESPCCYILEIQQPCKNGDVVWVEVSTKYRYNTKGDIEVLGVSRNIEERKKIEEKIVYLSYYDQLTGLYNRRFYEEELIRLDNKKNLPMTLIMADVNGLKLTNDAFGHGVGDKLLKNIAEILKHQSKPNSILARTGGDEFVILLPKTSSSEAEVMIENLRKSIGTTKMDEVIVSVSFGWATKNDDHQDMENIFTQAEDFMYRRKLLESKSMKSETIKLITKSLYERDFREQNHCERVSKICKQIGHAMCLSTNEINDLGLLGLFHDIGKIGVNEKILNKQGKLNNKEWNEIKRHPEIGYQILRGVNEFAHIAEFVLCHHERPDGRGYPRGLKGHNIPLQSKILRVAEAYDIMVSPNSYKKALPQIEAIKELKNNIGTEFDGEIVKVLVEDVLKVDKK